MFSGLPVLSELYTAKYPVDVMAGALEAKKTRLEIDPLGKKIGLNFALMFAFDVAPTLLFSPFHGV